MNQKKKAPADISEDPDMIELDRMIKAGELDGDRAGEYAEKKQANNSLELSGG